MIQRMLSWRFYGRLFGALIVLAVVSVPTLAVTIQDVDIDHSGVIDLTDFISFAAAWGRTAEDGEPFYDWDGSGRVDFGDFLIFARFFGQSYTIPNLVFSLSGLADTLVVGQTDTLIITIAKNTIPPDCDILSIGIGGIQFEPTDLLGATPDSISYTSRVTAQKVGEFSIIVEVTACASPTLDSVKVVGVGE